MKKSNLSMEKTAATIMAIFSSYWARWVAGNGRFDEFRDQYYDYWIHSYVMLPSVKPGCTVDLTLISLSDQLVTLETVTPHKKVRITGLDDIGYLLTMPDPRAPGDPDTITLDYMSNSFDMMGSLIRRK